MGVCDVPVISTVCTTAGQGAGELIAAPFDYLAQASGQAAQWMFQNVWGVFDTTTAVDVTSPGYVAVYDILFGIGVIVALLFFCLQLVTGLIRRDPAALTRAGLGLAKSVIGSFLVITLTGAALQIVDELCIGIVQAAGTTMDQMGARIGALALGLTTISIGTPGVGAVVTIFLAGLAIAAAALLWFSLLIRKALLLVAIVMAPIALSGAAWDVTRGWFSKWAGFVLALIVSKLVVVVVFLVATAELAAPIDFDLASISQPIAGIALMAVAGFAPYLAYRLISFMGFDLSHTIASEQEAKAAMQRPVPAPARALAQKAQQVLRGKGAKSGGDASPAATPADPAPPDDPPNLDNPPTRDDTPPSAPDAANPTTPAEGTDTATGDTPAAAELGAVAVPAGLAALEAAKVAEDTATAGPKLGAAVGQATEQHARQADTVAPSATTADEPPKPGTRPAAPPAPSTPAPPATPTEPKQTTREDNS